MSSSDGEFDNSSATRGASDASATNKLNGSSNDLLKGKENGIINDAESDMTKSTNSTITTASIDGKNTNGSSCNEKIQQQDNRALYSSQDDEALAFKSQFDEIRCVSRMFENSKNNTYNRFQGFAGRAPLQRRVNENGAHSFHQRSHSHSTYSQQTNRHMLKPQRSISSINGLSFNGDSSAFSASKFYSPHGPSTPFTSYGFDSFDNKDDMFPSNSINGNDDVFMRYKDMENGGGRFGFNNSRFGSNSEEWDDSSSGYPSTPLSSGPFTPLPLTPSSSTYSNRSTYFAQPNSFLDDDELIEKAKLLEEERRLLSIQQRQLDNAIAAHKLWYNNSDPELNETDNRYKTTPPPIPTRGSSIPSLQRKFLGNKLTVPPPRFQNSQEPIGPPTRKSGYITPPSTTPTDSNSSSPSAPTFSLFSNPPALSFSHNLMNQQQKHKQTMFSDNHGSGLNGKFSPFNNDYPLTPSNSPPKIKNNDEGYFGFGSKNNIWAENNYFFSQQETKRNDFYPVSPAGHFRAPLYSSPVDEREESLFASEYLSLNNRRDYENNFILML